MKLSKFTSKDNVLKFEVKDGNDWYLNTLRRVMLVETPTMAIELVEMRKNDSILYDEVLTHRLGLVPLTTDLSSYKLPTAEEVESKEYLAQSSCKITLQAKGPCIVYAKDLKSKDPKIKPVYPDTPLVKLLENQELDFEAIAVLNIGKVHSKWNPGHIHYRKVPTITIKHPENLACAQVCPNGTLVEKAGKVQVTDERSCILCQACVDIDGGKSVSVETENSFLFTIESWGQLAPEEITKSALDTYTKQLKDFDLLVKNLE